MSVSPAKEKVRVTAAIRPLTAIATSSPPRSPSISPAIRVGRTGASGSYQVPP